MGVFPVQFTFCTLHLVQVHVEEKYLPSVQLLREPKQLTHFAVSVLEFPMQGFCIIWLFGQVLILAYFMDKSADCYSEKLLYKLDNKKKIE